MMPGDPMAGFRATQAQAAQRRAADEAEEETMTPYTPASLAADWEFKIIRSVYKQFGHQEARERFLAEEGRAGWVLVEVFDDTRIRLKRPRPAGPPEPIEGYDPYRTQMPFHPVPATPAQKAVGRLLLAGLMLGGTVGVLYATGVIR